jgi:uncharacterized protein YnzC (UPF0291/DUF896 family)
MGTEYENSEIFRRNFLTEFTQTLKERYPHATSLDQFDFTSIKLLAEK